ncbi:amino acid transporter [Aspergillus steynii IBT 23096]|uniref:Amino acid transporter n=1 Tax=Aspergillus steynii IBT 23096 TaxID=1392250 RepID=A0A2I2FV12_9EURO|nr:amino acid transporter [Aspergillus steynii IBT 23096]PLB44406.1 amino acid transporter [Aspergillus steynii IBT 23096]
MSTLIADQTEMKEVGAGHAPHHVLAETDGEASSDISNEVKVGFTASDQRDMQRMGKKQELRRNFRIVSTIGFTTCVMGTWEILLTSNTPGLIAGGRPALFWSLVWAYCGQFFIVLSLAEMASMAPTAGGQYHWVSEFAPRKYQKFLSYASGWLSTISWQSIVALDAYLVGTVVQGLISLNNESYVPTRWQGTLLVFAAAIGMSLFNIFGAKRLPLAEGIFVTCHFFAFIPVIVTLLVLAPKVKAEDVFTGFTDNGAGWPSISLTVMVGQVSSMFVVLGSDSVAHMSEEIENASVVVPKSMIWAFILNIPFAFGLLLSYLFSMPDVQASIDSPTGFPFIYVFHQALKDTAGSTVLVVVILVLLIMITISSLASASRQTFAFARDNGLPFSTWLSSVHPKLHIPVNSILFTCAFSMVMSLINIGSTVAFNALLSLSTVALMATYLICIGCIILRRINNDPPLPPSRWSLGKFGFPVNSMAMIYATWSFFWSFWPNEYQIDAQNFNWACVLFVGLMSISGVVYWVHARKMYDGPVVKVEGRRLA